MVSQSKLMSQTIPVCLLKLTLEFNLTQSFSIDHTVPNHYHLTHNLPIFSMNGSTFILIFHFRLGDSS